MRSARIFAASRSTAASSSPWVTPSSTSMPGPISARSSPSTRTAARLTLCTSARILGEYAILKSVLNYYPNTGTYAPEPVELLFAALSDPSRRAMVDRLTYGPASVSELARPLEMSLPAVVQHLHVLEASGLVRSEKVGRVRTCRIEPGGLRAAESWVTERRRSWEERLDRLGEYLSEQPEDPTNKE